MKFNVLILSLLLNLALVYSKSTEKNNANVFTISSSPLCETKKLDKNQKLYYASVVRLKIKYKYSFKFQY